MIFTAPAIRAYDSVARDVVDLPGNFTAAAVAGLISSLTPQTSPTNKVLPGVTELVQRFSYGETRDLIKDGVMVLEKRQGIRVSGASVPKWRPTVPSARSPPGASPTSPKPASGAHRTRSSAASTTSVSAKRSTGPLMDS
ncbi:hypothetical protein [Desulfosarcina cetonica]|uniref:hypothetical protein n=1 Tax=Desulfosarcina cetonica TaxID=90730 RepID=UPI001FF072B6|nr:hypothetical protein [Desulfosarcina cetonica]